MDSAALPAVASGDFELLYLDAGVERRGSLKTCWTERFEDVAPVRAFPSYRGQRNFPGLYFAVGMGRHVGFESWLERDHAMVLDFTAEVRAFAAQPFWLLWPWENGVRRHAPDFFVRLVDGGGVVVDVRADDRIEQRDAEAFAATAAACALVGWGYRRVGLLDPVLVANLRWLAGYRHRRCLRSQYHTRLLEVFVEPAPLLAGAEQVGDRLAVLPSVFHLLWNGALRVDLTSALLSSASVVSVAGAGR